MGFFTINGTENFSGIIKTKEDCIFYKEKILQQNVREKSGVSKK